MDERRFNQELRKIAPDLRLLLGPAPKKLWGVYQVRAEAAIKAGIVGSDGLPPEIRPWKLWDCTNEKGEFRLPDQRDLVRAAQTRQLAYKLWDDADAFADRLDAQDKARQDALDRQHQDRQDYYVEEMRKALRGRKTIRMS